MIQELKQLLEKYSIPFNTKIDGETETIILMVEGKLKGEAENWNDEFRSFWKKTKHLFEHSGYINKATDCGEWHIKMLNQKTK
jgi:hypothetical protein